MIARANVDQKTSYELSDENWTLGDRLERATAVLERTISEASASAFEVMDALHQLRDVQAELSAQGLTTSWCPQNRLDADGCNWPAFDTQGGMQ